MRFHVAAAALLGMITTAVADVSKLDSIHTPEKDSKVKVGTTEDIKWTIDAEEYTDAKINIAVLGGKDQDHLQVIGNIASKFYLSHALDLLCAYLCTSLFLRPVH